MRHYSQNTRKDALVGLKELLTKFPFLLNDNFGVIINALIKIMVDESEFVRQAAKNVLNSFFSSVEESKIMPFLSVAMAFLLSAMSHLKDDIKYDSLSFLEFFISNYPKLLASNAAKIIENLLKMFSVKARNSFSLTDNPKSKILKTRVISCLFKFLQLLNESHAREELSICPSVEWNHAGRFNWNFSVDQIKVFSLYFPCEEGSLGDAAVLLRSLFPVLIEAWIENAPSLALETFSLTPDTKALLEILQTIKIIVKLTAPSHRAFYLKDIQKRILPVFPFGQNILQMNKNVESFLIDLNSELAEILSFFLPCGNPLIEDAILFACQSYIKLHKLHFYHQLWSHMIRKAQFLEFVVKLAVEAHPSSTAKLESIAFIHKVITEINEVELDFLPSWISHCLNLIDTDYPCKAAVLSFLSDFVRKNGYGMYGSFLPLIQSKLAADSGEMNFYSTTGP